MANQIIHFLNLILSRIFEILMAWIAQWPLVALIVWSAGTGIVMAILFRFTSNQKGLGRAADRSRAELLAINLFQDDLGGVFRSLVRMLLHSAARIGYSIPPVLVIIVPLILLLAQLASWYEWRPLIPGESVVIELQIDRNHWNQGQHAQLTPPPGVTVEAGPLRDVGQLIVFWRLRPNPRSESGLQVGQLQWDVAGEKVEKSLAISSASRRLIPVSARRAGSAWWDQILNPQERGFSNDSPVRGIEIHYPHRATPVLGWELPWWLTFLIVSMIAALAVKPLVGVRF